MRSILAHASLTAALSASAAALAAEPDLGPEVRISPVMLNARVLPSPQATRRGKIAANEPFYVYAVMEGPACDLWGQVDLGAWACLDGTTTAAAIPRALPPLVDFDPPEPAEYETYIATGVYERHEGEDPLVPYVYGKRWRRFKGPVYTDAAAWERGDPPSQTLSRDRKFHFVDTVETSRGLGLLRPDGSVVPADEVYIYPISRLKGRDLLVDPLPEGTVVAWAVDYAGTKVYAAPSLRAEVGATLAWHTALVVRPAAAAPGKWWEVPDGLGPGVPGYVEDARGIRHQATAPPPADVGPDERWIDVDLSEQVLELRVGADVVYATLASTGAGFTHRTPTGAYHILDKAIYGDMASLPGAEDPYYVEHVPWVMHFKPRYALHGVFWHWGFGHVASHGCINLAPRDARAVFDWLAPTLPPGWHTVYADSAYPGTRVRVRGQARSVSGSTG